MSSYAHGMLTNAFYNGYSKIKRISRRFYTAVKFCQLCLSVLAKGALKVGYRLDSVALHSCRVT